MFNNNNNFKTLLKYFVAETQIKTPINGRYINHHHKCNLKIMPMEGRSYTGSCRSWRPSPRHTVEYGAYFKN